MYISCLEWSKSKVTNCHTSFVNVQISFFKVFAKFLISFFIIPVSLDTAGCILRQGSLPIFPVLILNCKSKKNKRLCKTFILTFRRIFYYYFTPAAEDAVLISCRHLTFKTKNGLCSWHLPASFAIICCELKMT